jgi:hypothetical protein
LHIEDPDILEDRDNKLLFKVTDKKTIQCATQFRDKYIISDIDVFITAEGLWLTSNPYFSTQPVVKGDSLQVANEFLFADRDLVNRDVFNMFNHLSEDVCLQFLSTVRAISRLTDEYVRFDDTNGHPYIVYANNGNVFIPTCINVNQIQVLTNFSNCYEDLPVIVTYISTNVSAFLTTDLILRTTSRIVNCNMIKYRFFDFPDSKILLKQIGTTVSQIKREDILWSAIDTNNVMMQRSNALTHFHGTLDGLDVLSSKPEYTDFNEHGRTFVALDREPDPLTPQSWWEQYKWYFYGSIIGLVSLILTCSLCWVCTCANCCLPKLLFNPCIVGYKQSKSFRKNLAKLSS